MFSGGFDAAIRGLAFTAGMAALAAGQPAFAQSGGSAPAAVRIGYIDVKRLIDNGPQFVESKARLQREFAPRDEAIKADEAKLAQLKQRYERDGAIMTKEDAETLKRQIDATERDNKRRAEEARADYNERASAETRRNLALINDTAIDYARTHGYDIVVASQAVLYASPRVDITDAVLARLKQIGQPAGAGETKP